MKNKINYKLILISLISFSLFFTNGITANAKEEINDKNEVELIAVGDNLIHSMIIKSGKQEDGTYNYDNIYENIKDEINKADIKAINQETVLVKDSNNYSGYPVFGSPLAIGDSVYKAGFNVITQATNHAFDKKEIGINNSINYWKNKDVLLLGINDSEIHKKEIKIKEINNIKFSFFNYTYGLNGFTLPNDKKYLVNTFMTNKEKEDMLSLIKKSKKISDFTIVFIHWGNEYKLKENEYQQNLAYEIANAGADLIIGTHPHVIEPLKYIYTEDGRTVPVFYSLGNFISNQNDLYTMLGGLAEVNFIKDNNDCYIRSCKLVPLVTHISTNQKEYKTYLLDEYSEDIIKNHKLYKNGLTIKYLKDTFDSVYKEKD